MELETYQDLASDEPKEAAEASFATIAQVFADGVTLRFDGWTRPRQSATRSIPSWFSGPATACG